jgi:hypothetical protein
MDWRESKKTESYANGLSVQQRLPLAHVTQPVPSRRRIRFAGL